MPINLKDNSYDISDNNKIIVQYNVNIIDYDIDSNKVSIAWINSSRSGKLTKEYYSHSMEYSKDFNSFKPRILSRKEDYESTKTLFLFNMLKKLYHNLHETMNLYAAEDVMFVSFSIQEIKTNNND